MTPTEIFRGRLRPLLLALLVAAAGSAWFGLVYVLSSKALPAPPEGGLWTTCVWDCDWYRSIATQGYDHVPARMESNIGFFPAFPTAVWLLMQGTRASFVAAGIGLNAGLSVLFCWLVLAHRDALALRSEREALVFLAAFLVSPWSLYNHVPYTEMLFNTTALGSFVMWRRGNYPAAAAFGIVLTATRISGVLLPMALLAELAWQERRRLGPLLLRPDGRVRALALMPFGLMGFMVFLYFHVGDPLGYFHIQAIGWGQGLRNPIEQIVAGLNGNARTLSSVVALGLITVLLGLGYYCRRVPGPLAAFAWLAPAMVTASVLMALPRYGLALFPIYLMVPAAPRVLQVPIIMLLAAGQCIYVYFWLQRGFFLQ